MAADDFIYLYQQSAVSTYYMNEEPLFSFRDKLDVDVIMR
jgi:hypothetical protein